MEKDVLFSKIEEYIKRFGSSGRFVHRLMECLSFPFAIVDVKTCEIEIANSGDFFKGGKCRDFFERDDNFCASDKCPLRSVVSSGEPVVVKVNDSNGGFFEIHGYPIFDSNGGVVKVIIYCIDIGQAKKLRETQMLFKSSIEGSGDLIFFSLDRNYNYLYFNKEHKKSMFANYNKDIRVGTNIFDYILDESDIKRSKSHYDRALDGEGHTAVDEYGFRDRSYYETTYSPIFNEDKNIIGVSVFAKNISEKMKAELELRESENRFRKFFESSPRGMLIYKVVSKNKLVLIDANTAADNILKINSTFLIGKTMEDIFPGLSQTKIPKIFYNIAKGEDSYYKSEILYNDENINGIYEFVAFQVSPGVVVTSFSDITEKRAIENKLKEKERAYVKEIENRFYSILQNSQDLVYRYNFRTGSFDYVSESVFTILGYSLGDFMKMNRDDYNKRVHPDDVKIVEDLGDASSDESVSSVEYRFKKKGGDFVWLRVHRVFFRDKEGGLLYSIEDLKDVTLEKTIIDERMKLEEKISWMRRRGAGVKGGYSLTDREKLVLWGICRYPLLNDEELAVKLDLKRSTLTSIKNRLRGKGWFSLNYFPNFHKLGYQFFSIFDVNLKSGRTKGLEIINNEPGVVLNNFQDDKLLACFVSNKYVNFRRFLDKFSDIDVAKYVLHEESFFYGLDDIELYDVSDLLNSLFKLNKKEKAIAYKFENGGEELNTNEKRILDAIVKNPEMSSSDIAKKIWTSNPTVIKVKKNLLHEGFIYPYIVPDFRKLGFSYIARLSFNFDSDSDLNILKSFGESGVILKALGKKRLVKIVLFASEDEYNEEVCLIRDLFQKNGVDIRFDSDIFPIQKRYFKNSKMENFINDGLFGDGLSN